MLLGTNLGWNFCTFHSIFWLGVNFLIWNLERTLQLTPKFMVGKSNFPFIFCCLYLKFFVDNTKERGNISIKGNIGEGTNLHWCGYWLMPCTLVTDAEFKFSSVVGNIYEVGVAHSVNDSCVVVNYVRPLMLLLHYCFAHIICILKKKLCAY